REGRQAARPLPIGAGNPDLLVARPRRHERDATAIGIEARLEIPLVSRLGQGAGDSRSFEGNSPEIQLVEPVLEGDGVAAAGGGRVLDLHSASGEKRRL